MFDFVAEVIKHNGVRKVLMNRLQQLVMVHRKLLNNTVVVRFRRRAKAKHIRNDGTIRFRGFVGTIVRNNSFVVTLVHRVRVDRREGETIRHGQDGKRSLKRQKG